MNSVETTTGTKQALLEAAARLFAERGFDPVSVRDVTSLAEANVASVKYHFGSRDELIEAVVFSMTTPVNRERLRCLEQLQKRDLRSLLRTFFEPIFSQIQASPLGETRYIQLMGRLMVPHSRHFSPDVIQQFREVAASFVPAFQEAVPGLSAEDVLRRIHFSYGVLSNALCNHQVLDQISEGRCGVADLSLTMEQVINFCEGGFLK